MLRLLPPPENTLKTTPEQKSNGSALLLGSLAALAVGIGIYIATKGKNGAPKTSSTKPVQQSQNNTANAFEDLRRRIINKFKMDETFWINKPQGMYSRILNVQYYQAVRHPVNPYSTRAACNSKIASITANSNSYVNVVPENGWHFRLPIQRSSAPLVDRISLNVYPEDALKQNLIN